MADDAHRDDNLDTDDEAVFREPSQPGKGRLLAVVVAAAALGIGVGTFVVGPRLVSASGSSASTTEPRRDAGAGGEGVELEWGEVFEIENLVVNPAGSQGGRFLMASIAVEVPDRTVLEALHQRELLVRDAVASTLEDQTVEMLTRDGARDSLKAEIARVVAPLAGDPKWLRVYLPRLVIQ